MNAMRRNKNEGGKRSVTKKLWNEAERPKSVGIVVEIVDLEEKQTGGVNESMGRKGSCFMESEGPWRGREGCGRLGGKEREYRGEENGGKSKKNSRDREKGTIESRTHCSDAEFHAPKTAASRSNSLSSI